MRKANVTRETKETKVDLTINLDGSGKYKIDTGIPFLDHMLELFASHGFFDLGLKAKGDLDIDCHHTIEDIGLVMGEGIADALGNKAGIKRYGFFVLPMDEVRITTAIDLSGRAFLVYNVNPSTKSISNIDVKLFHEFFQALSISAGMNLHIVQQSGCETHHTVEAIFKAFAKALDIAVSLDSRLKGNVPSTKGILDP